MWLAFTFSFFFLFLPGSSLSSFPLLSSTMRDQKRKNGDESDPLNFSLSEFPEIERSFLGARVGEFDRVACGDLSIGSLPPSPSGVHSITPTSRAPSARQTTAENSAGAGFDRGVFGDPLLDPHVLPTIDVHAVVPISRVTRPKRAAATIGAAAGGSAGVELSTLSVTSVEDLDEEYDPNRRRKIKPKAKGSKKKTKKLACSTRVREKVSKRMPSHVGFSDMIPSRVGQDASKSSSPGAVNVDLSPDEINICANMLRGFAVQNGGDGSQEFL